MPQGGAGTVQLVRTVSVSVNGSPLSEAVFERLVEARVSLTIGSASRLELRLDDDDFKLVDGSTFVIGAAVVVKISDETGVQTPVFDGEITSVGIEQVGGALHQLVIEAFDRSYLLSQKSQVKTYLKMKYSDIVSQIAGEVGLQATCTDTTVVHDYILQQGTDWAMLDEIAARTGMEWLVEGRKLLLRKRPTTAGLTVELGIDLIKFRARFSGASHVTAVKVRGWDSKTKQAIVGVAAPASSSAPAGASSPGGVSGFRSASKAGAYVTAALSPTSQNEAQAAADAIAMRNASHELFARGEMLGNPKARIGERLTVNGVGTKMSGSYYLTTVEHIFGRGDLITRFTAGGPQSEAIVDLLGGQTPEVGGWASRGLVTGLVTNINDPDGLNRVKVKFPSLSDQDESHWARLTSPMAGPGTGLVMMPRINDEVLVGFEQGDFRYPYVLGVLWNAADKPPYSPADGKINDYALKTTAGHVMQFIEEDGKEAIKFVHGKAADTKVVMEKEKVQVWVQGDKMVEIKAGSATIVIDKGDIKITAANIQIKGTAAIKLEAPTIEIKATAQLKMEGATVDLKGTGPVNVESSAILGLKGSLTKIN